MFIYTAIVFAASLLLVAGIDPLQLTLFSMAITALVLPISIAPFLVLMNDREYMGEYRNGWISNSVVILTLIKSSIATGRKWVRSMGSWWNCAIDSRRDWLISRRVQRPSTRSPT
jgi:Mn2+/Fe2+ NRAMP family transporter